MLHSELDLGSPHYRSPFTLRSAQIGQYPAIMETRASTVGPFDQAVSAALRAAAAERQVTQATITRVAEIAPRTLARYMAGESPIPVSKLVDITAVIGVGAGEVLDAAKVIANRSEKNTRR